MAASATPAAAPAAAWRDARALTPFLSPPRSRRRNSGPKPSSEKEHDNEENLLGSSHGPQNVELREQVTADSVFRWRAAAGGSRPCARLWLLIAAAGRIRAGPPRGARVLRRPRSGRRAAYA